MAMTPEEFDKFLRGDYREMGRGGKNLRRQAAIGLFSPMPSIRFPPQRRRGPRSTPIPIVRCWRSCAANSAMTGPHFGCGANECGACHVVIGDHAVAVLRHAAVVGRGQGCHPPSKGWATRKTRIRLQRAFIAEQAMQCGYCVPGILMSAAALLRRNPNPSPDDVKQALDRNLCRCGSHNRMIRAVLRAAADMAAS